MAKVKQLTVSCENRPGTLAHLARILGETKVNILACQVSTTGAPGAVQLVVDNVNKAKKVLNREVLWYTEEAVLHVELPNVPASLGSFVGKLAAKGINITSGYATVVKRARKASIVLAVSDLDKAARIR